MAIARDIGRAFAEVLRPDGKPAIPFNPDNLPKIDIKKISEETIDTASFEVEQNVEPSKTEVVKKSKRAVRRGIDNPLEQFASYTTLFTLACLKPEEVNNPYLYRNGQFAKNQVILSSAGRYGDERVPTAYGTPEYFIDNLNITSVIAPNEGTGASNATTFNFDVYEPYSAGLFLQSLASAAKYAGFASYLDGTPYVIKMEFVGFKDNGQLFYGVSPKFFVTTLKKVTFNVNEGGSTYKVEAVPHNHAGFSSLVNQTYSDIAITGSTVKELLVDSERSLQKVLNEYEDKKKKTGPFDFADKIEIHFPETSSTPIPGVTPTAETNRATKNTTNLNVRIKSATNTQNDVDFGTNPIGSSSLGFKVDDGGIYVSPRAQDTYDAATGKVQRDKVTIDPKTRTFQYANGQTLTAIISQAILSSDYAAKAIKDKPDANGRVNWFRIDVQIQLLDYDAKRADYAKRIIYRVMPYKVHSSVFMNPNAVPVGYDQLQSEIVKQYDYIYTGQNLNVLKFDIELNMAFYTAILPTPPQDAGRVANPDQTSSGQPDVNKGKIEEGQAGVAAQTALTGGIKVKPDPQAIKLPFGGSDNLTPEQLIANNFHLAFLQNGQANLVNVNLEILGDPYWLVDNGTGGYIPAPGQTEMVTEDGAANYESGDIYVYLRFRTPIEPKETSGDYLFLDQQDSQFSGIYKVTKCESKFNGGVFKQELKCIRMPLQASDFDEKPPASPSRLQMYNTEEPKEPTSQITEPDGVE